MEPIKLTLHSSRKLLIIPDTMAHLNGHVIITRTYSIYADRNSGNPLITREKESTLHLEPNPDPDYYGYITFEKPGSLFTYTADGALELAAEESNEVIECLSHERDEGEWKRRQE